MHNCAVDATVIADFPHMEKECICQLCELNDQK